jgi:hypothetical protein
MLIDTKTVGLSCVFISDHSLVQTERVLFDECVFKTPTASTPIVAIDELQTDPEIEAWPGRVDFLRCLDNQEEFTLARVRGDNPKGATTFEGQPIDGCTIRSQKIDGTCTQRVYNNTNSVPPNNSIST